MKIRNGFVSNSSSSSFVMLGYEVDSTKENKKWLLENIYKIDISSLPKDEWEENPVCCGKKRSEKFCPECGEQLEKIKRVEDADIDEVFYESIYEEESEFDIRADTDNGAPRDKILIGYDIASGLEDGGDGSCVIEEQIKKLEDNKLHEDVKIKLYWGSYCC